MEAYGRLSTLAEVSPCYLLKVRVIRARNLRRADSLNHTDCYLILWLPTASSVQFQTKTVQNSKDPVWNETFHFTVQSKAKNILELGVYDEDACQDEHLFTVCFDIAGLPLNERVLMTFHSNPKDHEELDVEFELRNALSAPETIITNGVLLSRQVCSLEFDVQKKKRQNSKHGLSLMVKGSHEGHQEYSFGSDSCVRPSYQSSFHYIKYKHPALDVKIPKKDLDYAFGPCSYNKEKRSLKVEINSIPTSKKIVLTENNQFALHVKTEDCQTGLDVRLEYGLCTQEQDFLNKRKNIVAGALKKVLRLGKDLQDHEVPVVAITTTGGSTRSMTAFYGSLRGLQKLNLLDCTTYITGLSGTTWTMANLYKEAYWSKKDLDEQINEVKRHVTKSKLDSFSMERLKYYNRQLRQRKQEGQKTSCIDLWGLLIEYLLNDGKDNHKLSDQQQAVNEGQNPLPIYTAINVKEKYSTIDFKEWVEFTPYEVGILKYGAFVRAEDFGSEFFMGRLMKRLPETRICYMQGMWSSIFSLNLLYFWNTSHSSEDFWHKWTQDQIADIDEEPHLPTRPHEQKTHLYTPAGPLSSAFRNVLTDRLSVAQYHNFLRGLQLNNSYLENDTFHRWKDTVLDSSSPNQLTQTEDYLSLIDTGFFINTSSAPLLRKERKVDVIIHLNYSAGSQSLPLKQSCKYYAEQGIPFPKAVLSEDDKHLKECYLFDDVENLEAPILVFFPQVNDTFRYYKAPGVKRSESEMKEGKVDVSSNCTPYSTYSLTFSKEEFDQLVELSEYNILNNQHLIMQALHTAVERKKTLK
ncbi:cytosolic phospholipase A2 epsilon-like isoform X1 [Rhineura floridana]|uniref:cytosolic phospholipase A2 epsilon-like isoform X1 n=2 Tax=Rhineura floridana TaxID=261503 RepID=UPI002AC87D76|nr:cytosolic phospholipase A2 epsilon-like isoform X1 [Rhineura floridana]